MSQENSQQDMRPEYDIRGGVRGRYFDQYRQGIKLEDSPLVAKNTTSAPQIGAITRQLSCPTPILSPKLQIGGPPTTHAGSNPSRR